MIFLQVKDFKFRKKYYKFEKLRQIKKYTITSLLSNLNYSNTTNIKRHRFFYLISKLNKKIISKVKLVRRCILTNRSRRVIRPYHISHTVFRNLNQFGLIPGFKKSIW